MRIPFIYSVDQLTQQVSPLNKVINHVLTKFFPELPASAHCTDTYCNIATGNFCYCFCVGPDLKCMFNAVLYKRDIFGFCIPWCQDPCQMTQWHLNDPACN